MTRSPIFIIGPPRSGTTLVAEILNQHPKIHITIETSYFEEVYPRFHNQKNSDPRVIAETILETNKKYLSDEQREQYVPEDINLDRFIETIRKEGISQPNPLTVYLRMQAEKRQKEIFGEKTPRHVFHLDTIRKYYPSAPIIFVVRNGLDFLASYKKKHGPNRPKNQPHLYHPVITSWQWKKSAENLLKYLNVSNSFVIYYKEMVCNPEKSIRELCDFLEIHFEENMLFPNTNNTSYGNKSSKKGIQKSSIGKWNDVLSPEEVHIFEQITHDQLNKLGFKKKDPSIRKTKLLSHYFSTPWGLLRTFMLKLMNISHPWSYLKRRL